jgi:predicted ATPase/DNA-binding CsgD family transcriptional regulator
MPTPNLQTPSESLSKRAVDILRLIDEGMSDRDIAERLVMTINTVKWYNRQIYSILDVGSRTQAIARARELQLLNEDTAPSINIVSRSSKHNLPVETTRFIGRKHEIEVIKQLLDTAHLLTLVGTPGTGKTRLALRVGQEVIDTFRDGVYVVSLAQISDPALVTSNIATCIGVNETPGQPLIETLKQVLRNSHMLLLLDNFEHLLPAATQVSELLTAAPYLKVLATSREPLHIYGEQEYAVPPLALPDAEHVNPQALADCESTALFMQQARAVRSDFELTPENALDVAQICHRLEGLPLAIELAAARSKLLMPSALLARLNSRLDTLTGGAHDLPTRQQTLRQTIDWSYNLLNEGEKSLFARLAVFRGGCSLEASEAICGEALPLDVFDGLASLVDKSLIQQKETLHGDLRFVMLETLHEYARERLEMSGEAEAIHRLHAEYFVRLAERAEPELRLAQQQRWFELLKTEHENMRVVFNWVLADGDLTLGVRLAGAVYLLWFAYGYHTEGQHWTQQLIARLDSVPTIYHPKLFNAAGHMTTFYDLEMAKDYFDRALQIYRDMDDKHNAAWSLVFKGYSMLLNETDEALTITEEGLALFRQFNDKPGMAQALNILGNITLYQGDFAQAKSAYEECQRIAEETGEIRRIRYMIGNLAVVAQREGDYERARQLAEQALKLSLEVNNTLDTAEVLMTLASIMTESGQPETATRLLGAWEAVLQHMGAASQSAIRPRIERTFDALRATLGDETFQALWDEGRALSLQQAVAIALEPTDV